MPSPITTIQQTYGIVGRDDELAMALAVLGAGRHLLLEGPVGVGKTTVALAVCRHLGREIVRVDGDDRYTEGKLTGWFDPPLVLQKGYNEGTFFAGPLVQAMRAGAALFINELNRMPEAVQNVLLPALDEGLLLVPRIGEIRAVDGFQVVATQNPVEYIATGHLSEALRDRFEHVGLEYQEAADEEAIVRRETGCDDPELVRQAVAVTRATRSDPRFRKGASVRAAIAMVGIVGAMTGASAAGGAVTDRAIVLRRAAGAALPTRVELNDEAETELAVALDEVVEARKKSAVQLDGGVAAAAARVAVRRPAPPPPPPALSAHDAHVMLAQRFGVESGEIDGWRVACDLRRVAAPGTDPGLRGYARRIAVEAVLRRATRLVGPIRRATRPVYEIMSEPQRGELEVERTLENVIGKRFPDRDDWIVEHREEHEQQVVLMMDASLSMAGENLAVAAVAAAVLALKIKPEDVAVVAFESTATVLSRLEQKDTPESLVDAILRQPARGYTNIEDALRAGARELRRGRSPRRAGLIITDGVSTAGGDPLPLAAEFPRLHVLLTEDYKMDVELCRRLAGAGRGEVFRVRDQRQLPGKMLDVANRVLR